MFTQSFVMTTRDRTAGTKKIVRNGRERRSVTLRSRAATKKATGFWMARVTAVSKRALRSDRQKMGSAKRICRKFESPMKRTGPRPLQSVRLKYALRVIGATIAKRMTAIPGVTSTAIDPGREKMDLLTGADLPWVFSKR